MALSTRLLLLPALAATIAGGALALTSVQAQPGPSNAAGAPRYVQAGAMPATRASAAQAVQGVFAAANRLAQELAQASVRSASSAGTSMDAIERASSSLHAERAALQSEQQSIAAQHQQLSAQASVLAREGAQLRLEDVQLRSRLAAAGGSASGSASTPGTQSPRDGGGFGDD